MTKAVAKKAESAVAAFDYGDHSNGGFENQTSEDVTTPFIKLLQKTSAESEVVAEGGVEGAEPGMFFNTVTKELIPATGLLFVAAVTEHIFTEWKPKMGGFVGRHEITSEIVEKARANCAFGEYKNGENDLIECFYVYGVMCSEEGEVVCPAVFPFSSTKIKAYKAWNSSLKLFTIGKQNPPLYAHLNRMSSYSTTNDLGKFAAIAVSPAQGDIKSSLLAPDDPRFLAAFELKKAMLDGELRTDEKNERNDESSSGKPPGADGEAAPF